MQDSRPGDGGLRGFALAGIMLGIIGALLDFFSGYLLIYGSGMPAGLMGTAQSNTAGVIWGIGVIALGVILAASTLAITLPVGARMMGDLGALMAIYGVAMLFFGGAMYLGATPMMQGGLITGLGMLVVGGLMVINGALMRLSPMKRPRAN